MSLLSYLSEYPGTLNDKTLAWLKSWSPGFENGTTEDLWMLYLSKYSGSLNDRMLQWARTTTSLPTASLGDALNALPDAGASYGGASLDLNFASQTYNTGAIGDIPPSVPFSSLVTFTRASYATYFDATGVLQIAANDAPRIDYDPVTLQPRGLLIEEARTNLLTYSGQFDNAVWAKTGATVSANTTIAPTGTTVADSLIEDTSTGTHNISVTGSGAAGAHTFTVYAKANTRSWVVLRAETINTWFDLSLGTIGTIGAGVTASISPAGNGWFRCSITRTFSAATAVVIRLSTGNNVDSYTGDGTSGIYIWGAQLEAGAFPTSYIPTGASQVTRPADVASVNTLSPWYNAVEGTLFVECSAIGVPPGAGTAVSFTDGTINNRIFVGQYFTTTRIGSVGVSSVDQAVFSVAAVTLNTPHKFAMALAENNFAGALDGLPPLTDNAGAIPTVTRLNIGAALGTSQKFCGHIRTIRYFPRKLANSELQAITV